MFSKIIKLPSDDFLNQAKNLANELYDLKKILEEATNDDSEARTNALLEKQGSKFESEVLKINPLIHSEDKQEALHKEIIEKREEILFETLTKSRDQILDQICSLEKVIQQVCYQAQVKLIETLQLKENAHNRTVLIKSGNLKNQISSFTDDDLVKVFLRINDAYQLLLKVINKGILGLSASLMFVPTKDTHPDISQKQYKMRAAIYADNQQYQIFKEMVNEFSKNNKALNGFIQYMDSHPDSRHLSKDLLNKLDPIMTEIEKSFSDSCKSTKTIIEIVEDSRTKDFEAIVNPRKTF